MGDWNGPVQGVEEKITASGKKYRQVMIGGKRFSLWDDDVQVANGDYVEVSYTSKQGNKPGQEFFTIRSLVLKKRPGEKQQEAYQKEATSREDSISRATAHRTAAILLSHIGAEGELGLNDLVGKFMTLSEQIFLWTKFGRWSEEDAPEGNPGEQEEIPF